MTDFQHEPPSRVILTIDDVRQWKADLLRLDAEFARIESERSDLARKLNAASLFLDVDAVQAADSVSPKPKSEAQELGNAVPVEAMPVPKSTRRRKSNVLTWGDAILTAVAVAPLGLTYAEVKRFVSKSELGEKLQKSDKGYHNAIGRLARDKKIVREHGRLFTPEAHRSFMQEVAEGRASTVVPMLLAHSPMGEAILKIVLKQQGLTGKAVIRELRKDPEFNATLTPHETGAYNIIARLVKRRQIIRRDDGALIVGPDFPKDLIEPEPAPSNVSNLFDAMKRNTDAV